ncbi:hypothetical protein BSKO_11570 [Bryopsis sp. KO-2023]|nr:hypothetical protein BSKO_11570 [Bryopsis sp. KO-2023]
MEEVIRARFDAGLLGTAHAALKRIVKRFASWSGRSADAQALLKDLSAVETSLNLGALGKRKCEARALEVEILKQKCESARKELSASEADVEERNSKRIKLEKVEVLREKLNKLPSRSQLEDEAEKAQSEIAELEKEIRVLQGEANGRKRKYRTLVDCLDRFVDSYGQGKKDQSRVEAPTPPTSQRLNGPVLT